MEIRYLLCSYNSRQWAREVTAADNCQWWWHCRGLSTPKPVGTARAQKRTLNIKLNPHHGVVLVIIRQPRSVTVVHTPTTVIAAFLHHFHTLQMQNKITTQVHIFQGPRRRKMPVLTRWWLGAKSEGAQITRPSVCPVTACHYVRSKKMKRVHGFRVTWLQ